MTVAELIRQLEGRDPGALVVVDHERHGWWSLEEPYDLQDKWVVFKGGEYESVDEGTDGAERAVRIF